MDGPWLQEKKGSASSLSSSPQSKSQPPSQHKHKRYHKRKPSSAWADQVEEHAAKTQLKKQCLGQIMGWPKAKPKLKAVPSAPNSLSSTPPAPPALNLDSYNHKDGDKLLLESLVASGDGRADVEHSPRSESDGPSCDTTSCDDSHSCDTHSTVSGDGMSCETLSSCDALSCDTLSCQSNDSSEGKKKKKKNKKKKRNHTAAEEGKKLFVGGIGYEDCDASLSNENETLATLRHQKFAQLFYLFGQVNRIQGHWDAGYPHIKFYENQTII